MVPEGAFDSAVLSYGLWELRWLWHRIIYFPFVQFLPNKVPKLPLDGLLLLPLLKLPLPVVVSVFELGGSQVVSKLGVDGALLEVDLDFMALPYVAVGLNPLRDAVNIFPADLDDLQQKDMSVYSAPVYGGDLIAGLELPQWSNSFLSSNGGAGSR